MARKKQPQQYSSNDDKNEGDKRIRGKADHEQEGSGAGAEGFFIGLSREYPPVGWPKGLRIGQTGAGYSVNAKLPLTSLRYSQMLEKKLQTYEQLRAMHAVRGEETLKEFDIALYRMNKIESIKSLQQAMTSSYRDTNTKGSYIFDIQNVLGPLARQGSRKERRVKNRDNNDRPWMTQLKRKSQTLWFWFWFEFELEG